MLHANEQRFSALCQGAGLSEESAEKFWNELLSHYSETHRYYHTLEHIDKMLGWLDLVSVGHIAIEFAIWYHDVIYDPRSGQNERLSADYFCSGIGSHLPPALMLEVRRLILATDHRALHSGADDESLLIDMDLSILGADVVDYDAYSRAIRLEYAHVPDNLYLEGRSAVLTGFLGKVIFTTLPFTNLEDAARKNVQRELATLIETGEILEP